jgi:eukaryotic-like serine/threonine-protein kinase
MLELSPRYQIQRDARLPQLDTSAARAYQAMDMEGTPGQAAARPVVAFLYQPGNVLPLEALRAYDRFQTPGMIHVLDFGAAARTGDPGRDFALIVEPPGEPVAASLAQPFAALSDEQIASGFVRRVLPALREIESRRTTHRAIRPTNLFWADAARSGIVLGPPMLSPPGQDQPSYLEPLESATADPRGRAGNVFADDMFALGVTLLMLATGRNPLKDEKPETVTLRRLEVGSFEALVGGSRLSTTMTEVVRGLLVDSRRERWGVAELAQWAVDGRRPNPPRVGQHKVAGRPLKVGQDEAFSARSLAYALARNWDQAGKVVTSEEFQTWLRRSLAEEAVVDRVTKVTRGAGETVNRERADKMLLNVLLALDPQAPMRYRDVAFQIEGLPKLLAGVLADAEGERDAAADLSNMIANALWNGWSTMQGTLSNEGSRIRSMLDRQRPVVVTREPGQGIERCLYELGQAVPCLSPLVVESCVVDLTDLLVALDRLPREAFVEDFLTDRHILAFLASRSSKITDQVLRQAVGRRSALQRLVQQVKMLALVQSSAKVVVPNLTMNLAHLLKQTADQEIRGSELKELVLKDLDAAAPQGKIEALLKTLEESGALEADRRGFEAARAEYAEVRRKLVDLKDQLTKATKRAAALGPQIAGLIGVASALAAIAMMALMGVGF